MLHNRELESTLEAMKHKEKEEPGEVATATAPKTRSAIKRIKNRTDRKENPMPDFEVIKPKKGARKNRDEVVDLSHQPSLFSDPPLFLESLPRLSLHFLPPLLYFSLLQPQLY